MDSSFDVKSKISEENGNNFFDSGAFSNFSITVFNRFD